MVIRTVFNDAFTADNPAQSLSELLDAFRRDEPDKYCYRGQPRHHGNLVPSGLRARIDFSKPMRLGIYRDLVPISAGIADRRHRERQIARNNLLREFGQGVGHILAQQYGLTSETIDVTDSIDAAAFFATRSYPYYDHIDDDPSLGVIYRMPNFLQEHDLTLSTFQKLESLVRLHDGALRTQHGLITAEFSAMSEDERAWATSGERLLMSTRPMLCTPAALKNILTSGVGRPVGVALGRDGREHAWPPDDWSSTRLSAQSGGFLRPSMVITGFQFGRGVQRGDKDTGLWVRHDIRLIAESVVAMQEPETVSWIEPYFFRHTEHDRISLEPEDLWPGPDADVVLDILCARLERDHHRYLTEVGASSVWDPNVGLLDRGHMPRP